VFKEEGKIISSDAAASIAAIPNRSPKIPGQINLGVSSSPLVNFPGVLNRLQCDIMIQAPEQDPGSNLIERDTKSFFPVHTNTIICPNPAISGS
jgi:hypothetical protein